jgi:CDGSH-type Zn-finger protein
MTTTIRVNRNGSLKIEGDIQLLDCEGKAYDLSGRTAISLCRCGQSQNKPFCDGAHKSCGFESDVVATTLPPPKAK